MSGKWGMTRDAQRENPNQRANKTPETKRAASSISFAPARKHAAQPSPEALPPPLPLLPVVVVVVGEPSRLLFEGRLYRAGFAGGGERPGAGAACACVGGRGVGPRGGGRGGRGGRANMPAGGREWVGKRLVVAAGVGVVGRRLGEEGPGAQRGGGLVLGLLGGIPWERWTCRGLGGFAEDGVAVAEERFGGAWEVGFCGGVVVAVGVIVVGVDHADIIVIGGRQICEYGHGAKIVFADRVSMWLGLVVQSR